MSKAPLKTIVSTNVVSESGRRTTDRNSDGVGKANAVRWRNKARRRALIISEATAVFSERGYDGATLREIARRSGCSLALVSSYFPTKKDLLSAVIQHSQSERQSALSSRGGADEPLADALLAILRWNYETYWATRDISRTIRGQMILHPELGSTIGQETHAVNLRTHRDLLIEHDRKGHLRASLNLDAAAYLIAAVSYYLCFHSQIALNLDRSYVGALVDECAQLLTQALGQESLASDSPGRQQPGALSEEETRILDAYRRASPELRRIFVITAAAV